MVDKYFVWLEITVAIIQNLVTAAYVSKNIMIVITVVMIVIAFLITMILLDTIVMKSIVMIKTIK